jgi:hypothetical protein
MLLKTAGTPFYSANSITEKEEWKERTNTERLNIATHFYYLRLMKMQEVTPHLNQPFHHHASWGKGKILGKETLGLLT